LKIDLNAEINKNKNAQEEITKLDKFNFIYKPNERFINENFLLYDIYIGETLNQ